MIHNYTQENLIQLLYHECDLFTKLEMEFAMEDDSTLLADFQNLLQAKLELPKVLFSPKKKSIDAVLAYSKSGIA